MNESALERITLELDTITANKPSCILKKNLECNIPQDEDIISALENCLSRSEKLADIQALGILCLQLFVEVNWLGRDFKLMTILM